MEIGELTYKCKIEVDDKEYLDKIKKMEQLTERFIESMNRIGDDIKVGVRIVFTDRKWYQFWK